jgi:hypothetical protein
VHRMAARGLDDWKVLEHGKIEKLTDRLWRVEGIVPGMSLRRVMTVAKRSSGGLVIHSAIALGEPEMAELEAWGKPELLLIPSGYHRLDAPAYKRRYPDLGVYAPRGSRSKIGEVIRVDGSYEDVPQDDAVQARTLPGTAEREGVLLVRGSDGVTVILNDVVMNMDRKKDVLGFLFTTLLGSAPGPRVSRLSKLAIVKDRGALKAELLRLAALPDLARLVVSHEKVASGRSDARAALERAATFL